MMNGVSQILPTVEQINLSLLTEAEAEDRETHESIVDGAIAGIDRLAALLALADRVAEESPHG